MSLLTVETPAGNQGSVDIATIALGANLVGLRRKASEEASRTPRMAVE